MHFGFKKVCVLIKRMREGHFFGESKQGAFEVCYRTRLLKLDYEILR